MWKHWIRYCRTQHVWSSTRTNLLTSEAHLCSQNSTSFQSVNVSEFFTGHILNVILMLVRNMVLGECGVQSCRCMQIQSWGWMWDQVVRTCSQVVHYSRLEEDFAPWDDPCLHLQHHRQQRSWVGTFVPCVFTKVCHVRHFPAGSECCTSFLHLLYLALYLLYVSFHSWVLWWLMCVREHGPSFQYLMRSINQFSIDDDEVSPLPAHLLLPLLEFHVLYIWSAQNPKP
jgi:hypothetical protein